MSIGYDNDRLRFNCILDLPGVEATGLKLHDMSNDHNPCVGTDITWSGTTPKVPVFNGATSIIDTGRDIIGVQACTISCWIYPLGWGAGRYGRLVDNGKTIFGVNETDGECLQLLSDGATRVVSAPASIVLSNLYHVAVTRTAAGLANFYINGQISGAANQNSGTPTAGTSNIIIGNRLAGDRSFYGQIIFPKIYNVVLTPAMIKSIYESERSTFGA